MKKPIIAYLKDEVLPDDKTEAHKFQHLATRSKEGNAGDL